MDPNVTTHFEIGWADALGRELSGDDDVWQRTRARGGKPFRIGNSASYSAHRGAERGGKSISASTRLEKALGKADDDGEE